MAPHSSTLAWRIPRMEEPGRLQSMGSLRVRQDWVTSLSLFTFMHQRRKWQPTPVFLPGESQGWGSLVGCHLWGHTESDTTEVTQHSVGCSDGKESSCNTGDLDSIRGSGRSPGEGNGLGTHSMILACRIPWTKEPGELQSVGSQSQTQLNA